MFTKQSQVCYIDIINGQPKLLIFNQFDISVDELISLIENIAVSVEAGQCNHESTNVLLSNLRIYGPKLEQISKDTLDRAFVAFRNASQDERLNIMTRLNLLELIELRAKSWQVSDGINTYYKHKAATNVDVSYLFI